MANYNGVATFPATENETLTAIETLAKQEIRGVKSVNRIEDGIFYYGEDEMRTGTVIEQAMIAKAAKQVFNKNKCFCDGSPVDPALTVRYFQNWTTSQWETALREDDIAAIMAKTGPATIESVTAEIIDSLTQAEGEEDFTNERGMILSTAALDYSSIMGGTPANMDGVLYAMRDMYNQIRYDTAGYTILDDKSATPESDIRIAVSDKLLALIDITKLANVFNLEKARIMGKLVVIPVGDLAQSEWFKVIVYDRKRFNRATKKYDYLQSPKQPGQYVKAYLTTIRMYFESPLFKATQLNCATAANAEFSRIITPNPVTPEETNAANAKSNLTAK